MAAEIFVLGLIVLAQLVTVLYFRYPPSIDGASHVATADIFVSLASGDPFYSEHFQVEFEPLPYWTVLALTVPLTAAFGAVWAYAISLGLYVVALPLSFLFLVRTVAPENTPLTPIVALATFSSWYWLGVSNFRFGQVFFLLAIAFFFRMRRENSWAIAGFVFSLAGAYFSHVMALAPLFGVLFLLLLIDQLEKRFGIEFELKLRPIQYALVGLAGATMALATYFTLFRPGLESNMAGFQWNLHPIRLAAIFANPFRSPTLVHWSPYVLLLFTVLVAWLAPYRHYILRRPLKAAWRATNPALFLCFLALTTVYYFVPESTLDVNGKPQEDLSSRFGPFAFLVAFASMKLRISPRARRIILFGAIAFALIKIPDAWNLHKVHHEIVTRLDRDVLTHLPENAMVLPVCSIAARDALGRYQREWMLIDYAILSRDIYSPAVYAAPGQQPLTHRHRPFYLKPEGYDPTPEDWDTYQYILLQSPDDERVERGWDSRVDLVASTPGFWLYRVRGS